MFEKVRDMLAEALNISADKITLESNVIEDLGADSLDMVELLGRLEDEEGVSIPEGRYCTRAGKNYKIKTSNKP